MTSAIELERMGVSQELFKLGEGRTRAVDFAPGQVVHEATDPADWFYLIESGEIRLYHVQTGGPMRLLDIFGSEDWLGSAVLGNLPTYGKRAQAVTSARLWAISAQDVRSILAGHANLAVQIIERVAKRLEQAWSEGSRLVFDDCRHRLVQTLLKFSTTSAAQTSEDGVVLRITHKQLAQAVGAARETISVCLTELRRQNIVRTGRNRLTFDPRQLEQMGN
jgi:CRP/FNR family transcriptional regulator